MRQAVSAVVFAFVALHTAGCGPSVSEEDLGRVIFEVPEIPKGYEPYTLPELVLPEPSEGSTAAETGEDAGVTKPQPVPSEP